MIWCKPERLHRYDSSRWTVLDVIVLGAWHHHLAHDIFSFTHIRVWFNCRVRGSGRNFQGSFCTQQEKRFCRKRILSCCGIHMEISFEGTRQRSRETSLLSSSSARSLGSLRFRAADRVTLIVCQVSVLHLSWEEFQMWKITPKLINCAAASSRGKTNMVFFL